MYYIYHIPGVKIGCSKNPKTRVRLQGYTDYEILEEHTDIDFASDREMVLQKQYGYTIDTCKYNQVDYSKMGKKGGNTQSELRNEKCSKLGKITGPLNVKLMLKNRRNYNGMNNPNCSIDEKTAQSILDFYTKLLRNSSSKYGLIPKTHKHFLHISKRIVRKICLRETWKHLNPS